MMTTRLAAADVQLDDVSEILDDPLRWWETLEAAKARTARAGAVHAPWSDVLEQLGVAHVTAAGCKKLVQALRLPGTWLGMLDAAAVPVSARVTLAQLHAKNPADAAGLIALFASNQQWPLLHSAALGVQKGLPPAAALAAAQGRLDAGIAARAAALAAIEPNDTPLEPTGQFPQSILDTACAAIRTVNALLAEGQRPTPANVAELIRELGTAGRLLHPR